MDWYSGAEARTDTALSAVPRSFCGTPVVDCLNRSGNSSSVDIGFSHSISQVAGIMDIRSSSISFKA